MAVQCPKCKNGNLKINEKMVYCENYKPKKNEQGEWINEGTCDFRILLHNKIWGNISRDEIKELVSKGEVISKNGKMKMILDLENPYFTRIEFIEKEDEYL
jgi:hypothetical protein